VRHSPVRQDASLCCHPTACVCPSQVASLGRQLLQERTKVKALSEELESPLNVHRCAGGGFCASGASKQDPA
jgi:hypothetical protein